jgi:hypothetical protein
VVLSCNPKHLGGRGKENREFQVSLSFLGRNCLKKPKKKKEKMKGGFILFHYFLTVWSL